MAKAALEAMNGFNVYGDKGSNWSVVYVDVVRIKVIII
jgi:phosphorylase kinase alpha/beta subunit